MSPNRWRLGVPVVLIALAAALTACQDEPSQPSPVQRVLGKGDQYVALGDSYTAAPNTGPKVANNGCFNTEVNYPHRIADATGMDLVDNSCNGATTNALTIPQQIGFNRENVAQLDGVERGHRPRHDPVGRQQRQLVLADHLLLAAVRPGSSGDAVCRRGCQEGRPQPATCARRSAGRPGGCRRRDPGPSARCADRRHRLSAARPRRGHLRAAGAARGRLRLRARPHRGPQRGAAGGSGERRCALHRHVRRQRGARHLRRRAVDRRSPDRTGGRDGMASVRRRGARRSRSWCSAGSCIEEWSEAPPISARR